jgi:hypothetical protein
MVEPLTVFLLVSQSGAVSSVNSSAYLLRNMGCILNRIVIPVPSIVQGDKNSVHEHNHISYATLLLGNKHLHLSTKIQMFSLTLS